MYLITFALFVISIELVVFYDFPKILPVFFFIGIICVRFLIKPLVEELDTGGHYEITVDSEKNYLQIDDNKPVNLDDISYVYLKLFKPNYISVTMIDSIISLISINCELLIGYKNGNYTQINIQRKSALLGLIKELQQHSEIRIKFDDNYEGNLTSRFPWLLFLLFIVLLIYLFQR